MISGASRGIGKAIARRLYQSGYKLSLSSRTPDAMQQELQHQMNSQRLLCQYYEVEDTQTTQDWVDATIGKYGRIDGIVNNAGIYLDCCVHEGDETSLESL
ncbi:hypothetical protein BOW52_09390 [Solemya elarraichensis gill symbiont]|uniref:3-oxoacyl-ACP reductase n=2 Tax=Solemya elarraichensis gill symbiont TaxID=1918949 RepID=A0A1T2KZA1_9GAMM|nr:hypothetical protein BOW52_09390 [Solemya elarraichensis gill symbiont]